MKSIIKSNRTLFITLLTLALVFGFTSTALAYEYDQPNYGDPITVDGIITDWDLTADHFSVMYLNADTNGNIIADAYLRYSHSQNILYILVLPRNGQDLSTTNGQLVDIDGSRVIERPYLLPDGSPRPDFAFINLSPDGEIAEGWEASVPLDIGEYDEIQIQVRLENGDKAWFQLPLNIYRLDFGDLPDSYGTYEASSGPKHSAGRLRLGLQVDGESDGQPGTNPILDDVNGRNDEDGVITIGNWRSGTPTFQYTVNGCSAPPCFLSAWIDWGEYDEDLKSWLPDGTFGITDTLFINEPVVNGTETFTFTIPANVGFAATFNTRFRLCDTTDACNTPLDTSSGDAPLGEVEDYQWSFDPNAVSLNSFTASPTQNPTIVYILAGSVAVILLLGTATFVQKRKNQ